MDRASSCPYRNADERLRNLAFGAPKVRAAVANALNVLNLLTLAIAAILGTRSVV